MIKISPCRDCGRPAFDPGNFLIRRLFVQWECLHDATTDEDHRTFAEGIEKLVSEGPEDKLPFKVVRSID